MAVYHVGCGISGLFAGTLNKKGDKWINKSDVTYESIEAVAQYLIQTNSTVKFDYAGTRYKINVSMIEEEVE